MNAHLSEPASGPIIRSRFPVLELINPRQLTPWVLLSIALGVGAAWLGYRIWSIPLWMSTLIVLAVLLPVGVFKWRDDRRRYGLTVMILSILLIAQGTHTIEHLVQWIEYHILYFTPRQSNGLLSPANSEWVHFIWNWSVLITVILLIVKGKVRNFWSFLLLGVAVGHTAEHSYALIRFLLVGQELATMNLICTAQGLPGILGQDGWLARSPVTYGTFVRDIPYLTTAIRLDVHFWWNAIEMTLSLIAAHFWLKNPHSTPQAAPPAVSTGDSAIPTPA
jgi:hypothetical protein